MRTSVVKSLGKAARVAVGGRIVATTPSNLIYTRTFASTGKDAKSKAYEDLLKTYSELADGDAPAAPMVKPPSAYLRERMAQPMTELSLEEMDAIAAACFTGDQADAEDPISRDVDKAISIWSDTAMKGSIMGLYQMGALQYEGIHMDKNDENAFDIFEQLVEEHSHPMSKVSKAAFCSYAPLCVLHVPLMCGVFMSCSICSV